jgi:hypothetical protein
MLTSQMWSSTEPMAFDLKFELIAEYDIETEVREPLRKLYSLILPGEISEGSVFTSPGPHLDAKKLQELITSGTLVDSLKPSVEGVKAILMGSATDPSKATSTTNKPLTDTTNTSTSPNNILPDWLNGAIANGVTGGTNIAGRTVTSASNVVGDLSRQLESCIVDKISINLGNHMYFPSVVITSVSHTDPVRPNAEGHMIMSEVTIAFRTFFVPTANDILKLIPKAVPKWE